MVIVTLVSEEFSVTQTAYRCRRGKLSTFQGSLGFEEIGAAFSFAGGAPFTVTGIMTEVFAVVSTVTVVAEAGYAEGPSERIASVVMSVFLDESDNLARQRSGGSSKNEHVRRINGHDLDLILGQGDLRSFEFGVVEIGIKDPPLIIIVIFGECLLLGGTTGILQ